MNSDTRVCVRVCARVCVRVRQKQQLVGNMKAPGLQWNFRNMWLLSTVWILSVVSESMQCYFQWIHTTLGTNLYNHLQLIRVVADGVYHNLGICGVLLVVFVLALSFVRSVQLLIENRKFPPGPWGFPIIGYLPLMKGVCHLHYNDLARKYGSMFSTRLGNQLVVVLSDHKIIREAFRREEFTGRPRTEFMNILDGYGEYRFVHSEMLIDTTKCFHCIYIFLCACYKHKGMPSFKVSFIVLTLPS